MGSALEACVEARHSVTSVLACHSKSHCLRKATVGSDLVCDRVPRFWTRANAHLSLSCASHYVLSPDLILAISGSCARSEQLVAH